MAPRTLLPLAALALLAGAAALTLRPGGAPEQGREAADDDTSAAERRGALVDEVVFTEESDPGRITALIERGRYQVFGQGVDSPAIFRQIQRSAEVDHALSHGTSVELTLNPAEFEEGGLNPFHVRAVREAMNWLVDRRYIADELFGGLAVPRYLPINTALPDYARLAEAARKLELEYRHDPQRAQAVISEEMRKLGAERRDGQWYHEGEPVRLTVLIRTEDRRERVGDYVANQLEELGFAVERLYRTAEEASRIWIASDPAAGRWHIYTGGWQSTAIDRDVSDNFNYYYTPRGRPDPLWQAYDPRPAFSEVAERLESSDYTSTAQRNQLMRRALELAMEDSARVWLADQRSVWPHAQGVRLATDLAGGISGSRLWPYTLRYTDRIGGRVDIAVPSMLTEPWNPVAGSNWISDQMILRALDDPALLPDPFTGLPRPQRIDSAEVTVTEDAPVEKTLDWVALRTAERIRVPEDAWIGWDAEAQRIATVGERHPDGLTARSRTVLRYEEGYLERRWHDGSRVSVADLVAPWILTFARADEASPLYDPSHQPRFEVYEGHFRGWRITSTDPLTVELYSDQILPDAESIAARRAPGPLPWHVLSLGIQAERRGQLAFSSSKADSEGVEWLNLVSGPSLEILRERLRSAAGAGRVPFADALEPWLRDDEPQARYRALRQWYAEHGHFWVGDGPFYLDAVHPVAGSIVLRRFADFPDPADKWLRFTEPRIPEVETEGPLVAEQGSAMAVELAVTYAGEPYPRGGITGVRFLLFDSDDTLVREGRAQRVGDGRWRVRLDAETLAELGNGGNSLEAIVTSRHVALPAFATHAFATVPQRAGKADAEENRP